MSETPINVETEGAMISESEKHELRRGFKFETDEELDRKRKVYLSFVVSHAEEQANIQAIATARDATAILLSIILGSHSPSVTELGVVGSAN